MSNCNKDGKKASIQHLSDAGQQFCLVKRYIIPEVILDMKGHGQQDLTVRISEINVKIHQQPQDYRCVTSVDSHIASI